MSAERLALALWGEEAQAEAVSRVQVDVSRLRRALGDGAPIETSAGGYALHVRPGELDLERFERDVGRGREALEAGDGARGSELLRTALALWRGPPFADLAALPFAAGEIARLEERRHGADGADRALRRATRQRAEWTGASDVLLLRTQHGRLVPRSGASLGAVIGAERRRRMSGMPRAWRQRALQRRDHVRSGARRRGRRCVASLGLTTCRQ